MKIILLCVCVVLLSSSSCEEVVKDVPSSETQTEEIGTRATVTTEYSDIGCAVLLEIEEDGQKVLLMPIELDDQYKVNGTEVMIEFRLSRIMQSECQKGRPIVIDQIRLVE